METIEKIVEAADVGSRLDKYLAMMLPELTRTRIQQFINEGLVLVNGKTEKKQL